MNEKLPLIFASTNDYTHLFSFFPMELSTQAIVLIEDAQIVRGFLVTKSVWENDAFFYDGDRLWFVTKDKEALSFDLKETYQSIFLKNISSDPLFRALGSKGKKFRIWDLTAGTFKDTLHFKKLGMDVLAFERSLVVFSLLKNALDKNDFSVDLVYGEAHKIYSCDFEDSLRPDIIYYDPMFETIDSKKAMPRKEMRLFHYLLGKEENKCAEEKDILLWAKKTARERVIVKRHPKAPAILSPTFTLESKAVRFDVYQC